MNPEVDWQMEATAAADWVGDDLIEAHRGAIPWRYLGVCVAFGNDGFRNDPRPQREVAALRELLAAHGLVELGFGTGTDDGYTYLFTSL